MDFTSYTNAAKDPTEPRSEQTEDLGDDIATVDVIKPYGLSPGITYEEYLKDPVCQLRWFNYKVTAYIGSNRKHLIPMLTVVDTGAGPNLIREGACPEGALNNIDTTRRIANLRGASRYKLHTLGIVTLTVKVGTQVHRCPFIAVRNLGADALLGCSYTDHYVEATMCIKRHIVLENGDIVPIQRRRALPPTINGPPEEQPGVRTRASNSVNVVRTVERVKVPAFSDQIITVKCCHYGPRLVEPLTELMNRKSLAIESATINIPVGQTFHVRIINHSGEDQFLFKNARVGYAVLIFGEREAQIAEVDDDVSKAGIEEFDEVNFVTGKPEPSDLCPITEFVNMVTFEGDEVEGFAADPGPSFMTTLPSTTQTDKKSVEDIRLDELDTEQSAEVRELLRPFSAMWQGQIGQIKATTHHIDLVPNARPQRQQPYRAGPEKRKII